MAGPRLPRLVLATGNPHKVEELSSILCELLDGAAFQILTPRDFPGVAEPAEDGETFEANALIKARYWAAISGLPALADDSGLVVDALDGRPGVQSARYAPTAPERNARVLREMEAVADGARAARFVCVAALAQPGGMETHRRGTVEGIITHAPRGAAGFGYDPIFELIEPPHAGRTMAELTDMQKNALSHRGRAMRALGPELLNCLLAGGLPA